MLSAIAKPFGWLLMQLYLFFENYGIAVIVFALLIRLIMLPFMAKSKRSTMKTSRLQPKIQELQKKHGANQRKLNEETQKLYREEKINPMSGCLWSFLPLPILIALFQAIRYPITIMMGVEKSLIEAGGAISQKLADMGFTSGISEPYLQIAQSQFITEHFDAFSSISDKLVAIDYTFLGINLGTQPNWRAPYMTDWSNIDVWSHDLILFAIPIIAALMTFLQTKISLKMNQTNAQMPGGGSMKTMMYMMPLITLWMAFIMPASLGIYWIVATIFGAVQDIVLTKKYQKVFAKEDAEKIALEKEREQELQEKRKETEKLRSLNATAQNPSTSKKKQHKQQRLEQAAKAAEWEKKNAALKEGGEGEKSSSSVGNRTYARGRAYDPERYANAEKKEEAEALSEEQAESLEEEVKAIASETAEGADTEVTQSEEVTEVETGEEKE